MNKFSKVVIGAVVSFVVVAMTQLQAQDSTRLERVQSGELQLTCHLPKGVTAIEPELITGYDGELWEFQNGSAKSCWTK